MMVLDCFKLHVFYFEKLSTWIWRLPLSVNVILNLSNKVQILDQVEGTIDNKQLRFDIDLIPRGHEEEKI